MTSNRYEVYPAKVVNMDTSLNLELESANHNKYKHNMWSMITSFSLYWSLTPLIS